MQPNKWDKFKYEDSDCDDEEGRLKAPADLGLPKAKLITAPWDPYCEEVRWALTRHGVPFTEYAYPWPLNHLAALEYSDPMPHKQHTTVPVFINYKNEVYKRSTADIFMFLYAHSFNTSLKVYSEPNALVLQEMLGQVFAPAVTTIFLSTYLLDPIHLNSHSAIIHTFWPASKASVYISSSSFTAADIAFSAHAMLVLYPNEQDDGESGCKGLGMTLPSLKELPEAIAEKVKTLRNRSSWKTRNNPWWAKDREGTILIQYTYTAVFAYFLLWIMVATSSLQTVSLFLIAQITFAALGYHRYIFPTVWHQRIKQILFQLRGKYELTERDRVEAEQAAKDKEAAEEKKDKVVATKKVKA
ncbi:hypothetical protein BDR26DRAFT_859871 [Obelidium mucronatum]|nr:hypothetical protein BDR26DRAFT_859871 [Obelidium mucronatum]